MSLGRGVSGVDRGKRREGGHTEARAAKAAMMAA